MWFSAILSLLTAIFRAFPTIENLVGLALKASKQAKEAEAIMRKESKDNLVDAAIDKKDTNENNNINA